MIVIYGFLFLFLFLPVLGEFLILIGDLDFFVTPTWGLFLTNFIFSSIIIFVAVIIPKMRNNKDIVLVKPNLILRRCFIIICLCVVFLFGMAGYKFLFLGIDRGQLRVGMGLLGPLYTWVIGFLVPMVCALAYLASVQVETRRSKLIIFFVILFALLCAVFTGYKAVIVTVFLPALTLYFFKKRNLYHIIKYSGLALFSIVCTTMLVRDISLSDAWFFFQHRGSVMTAAGTIAVGQEFPDGVPVAQSIRLAYGALGNHLSTLLTGYNSSSLSFLDTNLARYISYLVYPNKEAVLSGEVNLTVTSFGEAIYMCGFNNGIYIVYAIISAFYIGYVLRLFKRNMHKNIVWGLTLLSYIYGVVLPSLNSGGIWSLFAPTSLVYVFLTYLALLFIIKGRFRLV